MEHDRGERGERGEQGIHGDRGMPGIQGERGLQGEGWGENRKLVLHELTELRTDIQLMDGRNRQDHALVIAEINEVKSEISALKVKSGFFGGLAGLGAGIAVFLAQILGHFGLPGK
jgi:hypothetical protein